MKAENYILTEDNKMFIFSALNRVIAENVTVKNEKIQVSIKNRPTAKEIREIAQNSLNWHWIKEIQNQRMEYTNVNEIHNINKLNIGVPILMEVEEFAQGWDCIKNLKYEIQLKMMDKKNKFYLPVTSIMNQKQMKTYLNRMKQIWQNQGVHLTDKEDLMNRAFK